LISFRNREPRKPADFPISKTILPISKRHPEPKHTKALASFSILAAKGGICSAALKGYQTSASSEPFKAQSGLLG
jgi:hypothetical protein